LSSQCPPRTVDLGTLARSPTLSLLQTRRPSCPSFSQLPLFYPWFLALTPHWPIAVRPIPARDRSVSNTGRLIDLRTQEGRPESRSLDRTVAFVRLAGCPPPYSAPRAGDSASQRWRLPEAADKSSNLEPPQRALLRTVAQVRMEQNEGPRSGGRFPREATARRSLEEQPFIWSRNISRM
jgi:hypothetical protein